MLKPLLYLVITTIFISTQPAQIENYSNFYLDQQMEYALSQRDDQTSTLIGNSLSNMYNGGWVTEQGEWIYYSNRNDFKTYRIRKDGTEKELIYDEFLYYINVVGEWLYGGVVVDNFEPLLVRMKIDGSEFQYFDFCIDAYSTKDGIYFTGFNDEGAKDRLLYKLDYRTSEIKEIMSFKDDGYMYFIHDDWVYHKERDYSGEYPISLTSRTKLDGSETQRVNDNKMGMMLYKNKYYYFMDDEVYREDIDGSNREMILKCKTGSINIYDDVLYYENREDELKMYKMPLDTLKSEKFLDQKEFSRVNIVEGWIYYESDGDFYRRRLDGSGEAEYVE